MYSNIHPFFQFQILAVSLIGALTDPPSDPPHPPAPPYIRYSVNVRNFKVHNIHVSYSSLHQGLFK